MHIGLYRIRTGQLLYFFKSDLNYVQHIRYLISSKKKKYCIGAFTAYTISSTHKTILLPCVKQ